MEGRMESAPKGDAEQAALIRIFQFFESEDGGKIEVATKSLPRFAAINKETFGEHDSFSHAQSLIDAFQKAKVLAKLATDIEKRPHLLICGGFVRDMLLGTKPKDIDFVTNATYAEAEEILTNAFQQELASEEVSLDSTGKQFSVLRIAFRERDGSPREEYEIASFRSDSTESDGRRPDDVQQEKRPGVDAFRRDLTVNALLYNPRTGTVIDYVGGLKDIADKKLRFVGDPKTRISEDSLRALRYVRFLFKTGFKEDEAAFAAISAQAPEIVRTLPPERIMQELRAMLQYPPYGDVIYTLDRFGLLTEIMPEVSSMKECPQGPPYHMEGDVFVHTKIVMNNLPPNSAPDVVLAALLHDVAKPMTRTSEPDK